MSGDGDREPSERVDVCVVGAGPAGALLAHDLADRGHEVVVLEAGPRFSAERRDRERRLERSLRPGDPRPPWDTGSAAAGTERRDAHTGSYPLNATRVKGVGGSTLRWQGIAPRLRASDFRTASTYGYGVDWPIDYADLRPYYARAERAMGVAGADDSPFGPDRSTPFPLPAFEPSYSDSLFAPACRALGVATHSLPNARTSEPYRDRPACVGYGTCRPVCPSGAKYTAEYHVRAAEDAGARVIDRVPVQRLVHDGARVTAAEYVTPDGRTHRQAARAVVVAAGGVETPRLLRLSRSAAYPDGLANGSGLVGRHFTDHVGFLVVGRLGEPTRQNHVGFPTTGTHQFYDDPDQRAATATADLGFAVPSRAERGAIQVEFSNYAGPSPVGIATASDSWGDDLLAEIRAEHGDWLAVRGLVETATRERNAVTLEAGETDDHGNPVPRVSFEPGERARRGVATANRIARAILTEVGADVEFAIAPEDAGPAAHHMGTTRMGEDPGTSVVTPRLRAHDHPNLWLVGSGVFPTGGGVNPTLTIGALSLRAADHLHEWL
jgi:choline dehydrogenase-like flavoprotein